jgi:hypothetical protein
LNFAKRLSCCCSPPSGRSLFRSGELKDEVRRRIERELDVREAHLTNRRAEESVWAADPGSKSQLYPHSVRCSTMKPDLLRIEVVDNEIIVSLPKSHLSATYYKSDKSPQLLAKRITEKYYPCTPMTRVRILS